MVVIKELEINTRGTNGWSANFKSLRNTLWNDLDDDEHIVLSVKTAAKKNQEAIAL